MSTRRFVAGGGVAFGVFAFGGITGRFWMCVATFVAVAAWALSKIAILAVADLDVRSRDRIGRFMMNAGVRPGWIPRDRVVPISARRVDDYERR